MPLELLHGLWLGDPATPRGFYPYFTRKDQT